MGSPRHILSSVATVGSLDLVGRLLLATLLGGLPGAERELDGQDAGLRTHLLLVLGAALFGAISVGAFGGFIADSSETTVRVDVSRVASSVAAGIGFIGGGTILKHRGTITGITTGPLGTAATDRRRELRGRCGGNAPRADERHVSDRATPR